MIADILPVPVLADSLPTPHCRAKVPETGNGEARESTEAVNNAVRLSDSENTDSRGGQKNLVKMPNGGFRSSRPKRVDQDAAYYRAYRKKKSVQVLEQDATRRERDRNKKWVVQTVTGLPDIGIKILSEFQVDVAMRAFWGKRKMAVPSATMGGILPSVSDFNEEVSALSHNNRTTGGHRRLKTE